MNADSLRSASVETSITSDGPGTQPKPRLYVEGDSKVRFYRLGKTATLFLAWICLGLYNEVVGPTLPDLKQRVGCDYEEIGRVLSARSAGLFIGSIAGGLVHDRWPWNRDLFIALALSLSAVTIIVAPWCQSLWQLGVVFHLMGHSHAFLTTGGNPLLAFLWAEKSPGAYNFLHSGFGLGATIGSMMSRPFLSASRDLMTISDWTNETLTSFNESFKEGLNVTVIKLTVPSTIEYPFAIVGILCIIVAALFAVFFLSPTPAEFAISPPTATSTVAVVDIAQSSISGHRRCTALVADFCTSRWSAFRRVITSPDFHFQLVIRSLMFTFYLFVIGGTRAFGKFVFSYAVDSPSLRLSKSSATLLTFVYWICYTVARLIVVVAARVILIHWLLLFQVSGMVLVSIGLLTLSTRLEAFWTFTAMFGFFQSPLFPSCLGWANQYIEITSTTIAIINLGSSIGGMIVQWLTGYGFQYHGPDSFLYITVFYSVAIFLLFVVMHLIGKRHGSRFQTTADDSLSVAARLRVTIARVLPVRRTVDNELSMEVGVELNGHRTAKSYDVQN